MADSSSRRSCEYECFMWVQDDIIPENIESIPSKDGFMVKFQFHWILDRDYPPHHDRKILKTYFELFYVMWPFKFYRGARLIMSPMLSSFGVPLREQESMIRRISSFAQRHDPTRRPNPKLVPIVVDVGLVFYVQHDFDEEEAMQWALSESMQLAQFKSTPATKSSVEALEKVTLGSTFTMDTDSKCAICFEEFHTGLEVTRMPCSHVYHGHCIVRWLQMEHQETPRF